MNFLIPTFLLLTLACVPAWSDPLIVAHRGASADAPENTLPAFELAWKQQADAIEGDFHLTGDGEIVAIHDEDTESLTGRRLVVKSTPLATLQRLDVGRWKDEKWSGIRMPVLKEVLATVPEGKKIYIEIKCGPEIVNSLVATLRKSGLDPKQLVLISFDGKLIRVLKQRLPELKAYWLVDFRDDPELLIPSIDQLVTALNFINADGVSTSVHPKLSQAGIAALKQAGFEYHVWTIDEAEEARRLRDWGVDSITTNRPWAIRSALAD